MGRPRRPAPKRRGGQCATIRYARASCPESAGLAHADMPSDACDARPEPFFRLTPRSRFARELQGEYDDVGPGTDTTELVRQLGDKLYGKREELANA